MIYDVVIIGSGPAGLTAAIYAQRARLHTLVIEKQPMGGGQILNTYEVDNYPGLPGIGGFEMGMKFKEHAEKLGTEFRTAEVKRLHTENGIHKIETADGIIEGRTVILATGASHRKLGVPGEEELGGMGVSYCATCDGAFFKNRTVAVVGGGDVALEDALFLARGCEKVYLIHRREEFRGAKLLQQRVKDASNIEILYDTVVEEICGTEMVESVSIYNKREEKRRNLPVNGVFLAVGISPNSDYVRDFVQMGEGGYIAAGEDCVTNVPGVFAAGDIRTKKLRQVITAAADGANAVASAEEYLYRSV
jgi:thioredoxin reductase (NADPH)